MLAPHDMDYPVPPEYQIRHRIAGRIHSDPPLENLSDETLFWIFYNLCREEAQLIAAKELYIRDWRFHKKKLRWITRVPGSVAIREGASEQGTYLCWDPVAVEKVVQQMTINYADLDDSPTTYQLSSNTLNARVHLNSPSYHPQVHQPHHPQQQQQQQMFTPSGGPNYFAQTGRIPRQSVPNMPPKLPVMSSMLPNTGSPIGPVLPSQQMPVAKPELKGGDSSTLPLVSAAAGAVSSSSSSADVVNATPVTSVTSS